MDGVGNSFVSWKPLETLRWSHYREDRHAGTVQPGCVGGGL
jgi:hypothetical protein